MRSIVSLPWVQCKPGSGYENKDCSLHMLRDISTSSVRAVADYSKL